MMPCGLYSERNSAEYKLDAILKPDFKLQMKKLLLTALLCLCLKVYAFNWVEVIDVQKDLDRIFVDSKSIKKQNKFVHFWQLSAYGFIEGPTQSTITRMKVTCSDEKQTHLVFQRSYKRLMTGGRILNSHKFLSESFYLRPPRIKPAVVKFVCDQAKKNNRPK